MDLWYLSHSQTFTPPHSTAFQLIKFGSKSWPRAQSLDLQLKVLTLVKRVRYNTWLINIALSKTKPSRQPQETLKEDTGEATHTQQTTTMNIHCERGQRSVFADSAKRTMMPQRDKWVICLLWYRCVHVPDSGERNPLGSSRCQTQHQLSALMIVTAGKSRSLQWWAWASGHSCFEWKYM